MKPDDTNPAPDAGGRGLYRAWTLAQVMPDPDGLERITGNNRKRLRQVAKLLFVMADGRAGAKLYAGSVSLGRLFDVPAKSVRRWLIQLEQQGVITMTWRGGRCLRDERGELYAPGDGDVDPQLVDRASEFRFNGLPPEK